MSTRSEAKRFAERILTSKGFTVSPGSGCGLIVNGLLINVTGSHINENRDSFYFNNVASDGCDIILCIGIREKTVKQKLTVYVIPAFEVTRIKNIRIPAEGWTQYMAYANRFDLIEKMVKRKELAG